ncbi:hypothetical protein JOD54_002171 [Actinokineospora baliensis]|uniref:hypothetical protein n=1 Tax=Actinokineospora baliensis TaxID=547056 RepID=UPI00195890DC|nr:hypothetical protein [Actinokineospora baliensis]MBM7771967.1 hypothetical protein [Actinokineospora baliensis]
MELRQTAGEKKFLAVTVATTTAVDTEDLVIRFAFTPYAAQAPGTTWHPGQWLSPIKTARILLGVGAVPLPTGLLKVWISASNGTEVVFDVLGTIRVS